MYSMALVKLNNPFYCFIALFSDDAQLAARKKLVFAKEAKTIIFPNLSKIIDLFMYAHGQFSSQI